jgi:hypothetical protein
VLAVYLFRSAEEKDWGTGISSCRRFWLRVGRGSLAEC